MVSEDERGEFGLVWFILDSISALCSNTLSEVAFLYILHSTTSCDQTRTQDEKKSCFLITELFFKVPLVRCNCQACGTRSWPNQSCFHLVLYLCRTQGSSWAQSHVLAQTSLWSYGRNQLLSNILSRLSCLVYLRCHASFPLAQRNTIPSPQLSISL